MFNKFVDIQKMNLENPNFFNVPNNSDIKNIEIGDYIKISNGIERFWIKINKYNKNKKILSGTIKTHLINKNKYDFNDEIIIRARNIYQITKKDF